MRPSSNNEKEIRRVIKKKLFLFLNEFMKKTIMTTINEVLLWKSMRNPRSFENFQL